MSTVLLFLALVFFVLAIVGVLSPTVFRHRKTGAVPPRFRLLLGNVVLSVLCLMAAAALHPAEEEAVSPEPPQAALEHVPAQPSETEPQNSGLDPRFVSPSPEQQWVMENVFSGMPWDEAEWIRRFGAWEPLPVQDRNPAIISNLYFHEIDMTVVVNLLKEEVVTWRFGRGGV